MINRGIYFMIASDKSSGEEGLRPNTSKLTRFNVALPLFKQRKIAFPEDLKESAAIIEFIEEITSVVAFAGTFRVNCPFSFVKALMDVPFTVTVAPINGEPSF